MAEDAVKTLRGSWYGSARRTLRPRLPGCIACGIVRRRYFNLIKNQLGRGQPIATPTLHESMWILRDSHVMSRLFLPDRHGAALPDLTLQAALPQALLIRAASFAPRRSSRRLTPAGMPRTDGAATLQVPGLPARMPPAHLDAYHTGLPGCKLRHQHGPEDLQIVDGAAGDPAQVVVRTICASIHCCRPASAQIGRQQLGPAGKAQDVSCQSFCAILTGFSWRRTSPPPRAPPCWSADTPPFTGIDPALPRCRHPQTG